MSTNKHLQSEILPNFYPSYSTDLVPTGNPRTPKNKERAASSYGFIKTWQISRDALDDIQTGADTRKYWRLATTHRDVYMAIRTVISAAFWVKGEVQANNNYEIDPQFEVLDKNIIELINYTFENMLYQSLEASLEDLMLYAMICGYGVGEKVFESIDGRWILRALKTKPSYDFTPIVDQWYNLYEIWHYPMGRAFHPGAFVWATWPRIVGGQWLGLSELQCIRHDLLLLQKMEEAQAKNAMILARSPLIDELNEEEMTQEEVITHRKALEKLLAGQGNGVMHIPATKNDKGEFASRYKLSVIENRTGAEAMNASANIINETKKEIKRALGNPDDIGNTTVAGGSWAKAQTVFNLLVARAEEGQRWIKDVVDRQIISDIVNFNYPNLPPGYKMPTYEYPEIQEEFNIQRADFIDKISKAGFITNTPEDTDWVRRFLGMPPKTEIIKDTINPNIGKKI